MTRLRATGGSPRIGRAEGGERKNALGGLRKLLKRLDPDKEIKINSFVLFGRAWLDLARFG